MRSMEPKLRENLLFFVVLGCSKDQRRLVPPAEVTFDRVSMKKGKKQIDIPDNKKSKKK